MNQWKSNKRLWYAAVLSVLLVMAFLVVSTGTAFARYRTEYNEQISFEVLERQMVTLGTMKTQTQADGSTKEVFVPTDSLHWQTTGDLSEMTFAIANGTSETEFSSRDQKITVRILSTLGVWNGTEVTNLYLHLPSEEKPGETEKLQAKVTQIGYETALYHTNGEGWIYSFQNSDTEELTWTLPGGEFSYITLTISKAASASHDAATLQPQVIAEVITN